MYASIPFKKQAFDIVKSFVVPPASIYQHLLFDAPFKVYIDKDISYCIYNKSCIENEIYWRGFAVTWEKASLNIWLNLCKVTSGHIFDIGSNTGIYALTAAAASKFSTVHAFEPHPVFFKWLVNNINLNKFDCNISPHLVALGSEDKFISIEDYGSAGNFINADAITLDSFVASHSIESVDLVKVDIEGMEPEFILGCCSTISKYRPVILIEILTDAAGEAIQDFFANLDYIFYHVNDNSCRLELVYSLVSLPFGRNFLLIPSDFKKCSYLF